MSFVYAMNEEDFVIMSDTKIGIDDKLGCLWEDAESRKLVEQFGMLKSVIVSPNVVVAFAGNNLDGAAKLLRQVGERECSLDEIVDMAYEIHAKDVDDIEFVIGYYKSETEKNLISIKDGKVIRGCKRVWLGSFDAYSEFMRLVGEMDETKYKEQYVYGIDEKGKIYCKKLNEKLAYSYELEKIFKLVIESGIDESVGGLSVRVKIPNGCSHFEYMEELGCVSSFWPQTIQSGVNIVIMQGAGKGSYCYKTHQSTKDFILYIYEDRLGVVYSDKVCYVDGLNGLKFPVLYRGVDEKVFEEMAGKYGGYSDIVYGV